MERVMRTRDGVVLGYVDTDEHDDEYYDMRSRRLSYKTSYTNGEETFFEKYQKKLHEFAKTHRNIDEVVDYGIDLLYEGLGYEQDSSGKWVKTRVD